MGPPVVASLPAASKRVGCAPHILHGVAAIVGLPYNHIPCMVCHMKTTLNIDDTVMADLKREAARQGRTMSELVEIALRLLLRARRKRKELRDLPTFNSGGHLVDIDDRDALYDAMEGR
jgi:Arc/MetJ family transcription regulator